jgi:hypothetical protein
MATLCVAAIGLSAITLLNDLNIPQGSLRFVQVIEVHPVIAEH